ncbi:MAG: replication restart helicase PriA [Candidatus Altimarinota bacterium]
MNNFAEIIIPQKLGHTDQETLTYAIPEELASLKPGQLVEIPLRKRQIRGVIWKIHQNKPTYNTRAILKITENAPHLTKIQLELAQFISEYYFCPLFKVIKLFLPVTFFEKKSLKLPPELKSTPHKKVELPTLTNEQQQALEKIDQAEQKVILLHGITGSGKTEVYCRETEKVLQQNQQALILIPEISLTPQTVANFEKRFGKNIAIIHSKLTPKQKENYWQRISRQEVKIIIGSRSAIFAPFQNLGLIVIDEEHEDSYKQDQAPRYHTRTIAEKISELSGIKTILGSATPAVETYFRALNKEFALIELNKRIPLQTPQGEKEKPLPVVEIIDLREELKKKNFTIFSEKLQQELTATLADQKQSILFLNRRGAASALLCRECGFSPKCDDCHTTLTYHNKLHVEESIYAANRLICHHCGKIYKTPSECPDCHGHQIKYIGIGTQKIEDHTLATYPHARVMRADRDTTKKRDQFEIIYHAFKDHLADILIGTQMIGKGLHLPQVTLVGIVLADTSLTIPDFRSAEKTFQLLTQVAGRAGRETPGKVIIQTYLPEHYAIQAAKHHHYKQFYHEEVGYRQELGYPPFSKLIKLTLEDKDEQKAYFAAQGLLQKLQEFQESLKSTENTAEKPSVEEITSYPALLPRFKNKYRWHLLINGSNPRDFLKKFNYKNPLSNDIKIDVDPLNTV